MFKINKNFKIKNSYAQGTIEYLVILAIVLAVSLVVVVLISNFSNSSNVFQSSDKLTDLGRGGGISVFEAIGDFEEISFLNLQNNSGEILTLKSISTSDGENEYDFPWGLGNKELFDVSGLCNCEIGQETKTCTFTLNIMTKYGLEKKYLQKITLQCLENPIPKKTPIPPILLDCFNIDDDPIQICSLSDLNRIREKLNGNYILLKDIDANETRNWRNGLGWDSIGVYNDSDPSYYFTGTFDGQKHTISNLYINEADRSQMGLFSFTSGNFNNVILLDVNIISAKDEWGNRSSYIGSIAGYLATGGSISNSYSTGNVVGDYQVGGLVGQMAYSSLSSSYFDGDVIGYSNVGGIVGYAYGTGSMVITNVYSKGKVNYGNNVGGVVGYFSSGLISNSYSLAELDAGASVGGFVGQMAGGIIINSYATGTINSTFASKGGFAGSKSNGTITNCGWWNGSGPSDAIGSPAGSVTYSESDVSSFYISTHDVYDSIVPYWTFGEDKNWITTTTYPILQWQE
jgi:hypothetical protein